MITSRKTIMLAAAVTAFTAGLCWNGTGGVVETGFFSEAQARIGRPLTPMSYAGVARRTTRRAVAVGGGRRGRRAPICAAGCLLCAVLRAGRGRLWPRHDPLLTAAARTCEAVGASSQFVLELC